MTPAQAAKAIEKVLTSEATKSDKARALFALGLTKTEAAELIPMNYSQAQSVWSKEGYASTRAAKAARIPAQARVRGMRQDANGDSQQRRSDGRALYLTPAQTRYITQDGHEVIRVDRAQDGATCLKCGKEVRFDLRYLGFVHKWSKSEPTNLEDRYAD